MMVGPGLKSCSFLQMYNLLKSGRRQEAEAEASILLQMPIEEEEEKECKAVLGEKIFGYEDYNYDPQNRIVQWGSISQVALERQGCVVIYNPIKLNHFTECFRDYIDFLLYGNVLPPEYYVVVTDEHLPFKPTYSINFGMHVPKSTPQPCKGKPVVVQLEQWDSHMFLKFNYDEVTVWEFNKPSLCKYPEWVEPTYVPMHKYILPEVPELEEKYDVVFIGCLNQHRLDVLGYFQQQGINVFCPNKDGHFLTTEKRDYYVDQAKIVLNIHYYPAGECEEQLRIIGALVRGKPVVSEPSYGSRGIALYGWDKEELVSQTKYLLSLTREKRIEVAAKLLNRVAPTTSGKYLLPLL